AEVVDDERAAWISLVDGARGADEPADHLHRAEARLRPTGARALEAGALVGDGHAPLEPPVERPAHREAGLAPETHQGRDLVFVRQRGARGDRGGEGEEGEAELHRLGTGVEASRFTCA